MKVSAVTAVRGCGNAVSLTKIFPDIPKFVSAYVNTALLVAVSTRCMLYDRYCCVKFNRSDSLMFTLNKPRVAALSSPTISVPVSSSTSALFSSNA